MENQNLKDIVRSGYNGVAPRYLDFALQEPAHRLKWTDKLIKVVPQASSILELGCGAGLPVTQYLLQQQNFNVTANDISPTQIDTAKREAPGAEYLVGDMTGLNFQHDTFHGVVMFFSLFHLPLDEQQVMLNRIHLWLKPNGCLLLSVGAESDPNHRGDWLGKPMFWANAGTAGTIEMLERAGFEIVESEVRKVEEEAEAKGTENPDEGVSFLWVLARKKT